MRRVVVVLLVVGILLCVCSTAGLAAFYASNRSQIDSAIQAMATPGPTRSPATGGDVAPPATATPPPARTPAPIREQWATAAIASSEYSNPAFSARQATGAPDTRVCGDFETAWASDRKSRQEWIEVSFSVPVYATRVVVHETNNPGNVVQIDLKEPNGTYHTIFKAKDPTTACPGQFAPRFEQTTYLVGAVRIYVEDPRDDWAEIDAVQLVGIPAQ